jgi:RNA polymerase sigma factor (sigma-70 family)
METRATARSNLGHNEADFESFFRGEYPRLVGALYLLTGNPGEAEELAQGAMARAFERWERISHMESRGGYVYGIALNLNRHRLRRLRFRARTLLRPGSTGDTPESVEARSDLMRAMAALPLGQRAALVLVEWVGLDSTEAGHVLGIEASAVRSRISRARVVLKERLEVEDE